MNDHKNEKILVIADGAAFGSEIDRVLKLIAERENAALYLPESFEWLILSAGVLENSSVTEVLAEPYAYAESEKYFSWERFFTAFLIDETKNTYLAYTKRKLNQAYLKNTVKEAILAQMEKISLTWKADE